MESKKDVERWTVRIQLMTILIMILAVVIIYEIFQITGLRCASTAELVSRGLK